MGLGALCRKNHGSHDSHGPKAHAIPALIAAAIDITTLILIEQHRHCLPDNWYIQTFIVILWCWSSLNVFVVFSILCGADRRFGSPGGHGDFRGFNKM